jgi:peptidyl-tRNA hydrolase, PTH1 family
VAKVLVGLGNHGEEYRATRHNLGYLVAEEIRSRHGRPRVEKRARSVLCRVIVGPTEVIVARPLTYMNRSGEAVAALMDLAQAGSRDLLIVCDDLYLDFGRLRLRSRGSHGGHKGLLSIIETLGSQDFPRLRVGVGPVDSGIPHADFVLLPFRRDEREQLAEIVANAADCAEAALTDGVQAAMNRFNKPARRRESEGSAGC